MTTFAFVVDVQHAIIFGTNMRPVAFTLHGTELSTPRALQQNTRLQSFFVNHVSWDTLGESL